MKKSKYYVRVMRPIFQRAVVTVEATSVEAATESALEKAERLTETDWTLLEGELPQPVIEIALSEEEAQDEAEGNPEVEALDFMRDVRHAYALLQADLDSGEGSFIAPTWLKAQPELIVADITQDWAETLSGISADDTEAFYSWLIGRGVPVTW